MLYLFLMANMGFALIHHSCHDCSSDSKELQLFVLAHSHSEQNECFIDQCSMNNHEECACNDLDKHQEECQVEVNRLTTPFITAEKNIQILKTDDFSVDYGFFSKAFENQNLLFRALFSSIPNLKPIWGINLLITHSIFRL
ncbi:MAG TPA: hypothetical protein VJ855_03890 [Marinilabiliaceae bacterium]|nr:hypothetical protein [Marinilabiliaceae bacterium]